MINIRSGEEIELIRESARMVAQSLDLAAELIGPGVTTGELDREIEDFIRSHGGTPEFKGFHGYPASICTSVNEEVVHGIPGKRVLEEESIVGIDIGVRKNGYVGDGARTFVLGEVPEEVLSLVGTTLDALLAGLEVVREGVHLSDVSNAIQRVAESRGYSVVRALAGHGVGAELHEPPEVPNYGPPGFGPILKAGMVLAIEPMINAGGPGVRTLEDGWTVVTADSRMSAHFEHTVAVSSEGADILTIA
jgi:methionyl aminopeptidase